MGKFRRSKINTLIFIYIGLYISLSHHLIHLFQLVVFFVKHLFLFFSLSLTLCFLFHTQIERDPITIDAIFVIFSDRIR